MIELTRRTALFGAASLACPALAQPASPWRTTAAAQLAEIERRAGGRLGVAAADSNTGLVIRHRDVERFPMCSTFKFLAVSALLARVDAGKESLERRIVIEKDKLEAYSPETHKHVGAEGMTFAALCEAAITLSDNTAANLILAALGGPAAVTAFARSLGDKETRLDRTEPAVNEATPGDPRDTTTPAAILNDMRTIILGEELTAHSRAQLLAWLAANKTGGKRLRASLPAGWQIGDKTGSGGHGTANDIAVITPPGRQPILVAVYFTESALSGDARDAVIADVGRVIAGR